jgi:hypothetical protein
MTPFDPAGYQDPLTIQRVIHGARTVAIVGLSNNHLRASYFVGFYLKRHGYRIIPVNPRESEILGEKSFNSLVEVPVPVDRRWCQGTGRTRTSRVPAAGPRPLSANQQVGELM